MKTLYVGWVWDHYFEDFADFKTHNRKKIVTNKLDKWKLSNRGQLLTGDRYEVGITEIHVPIKQKAHSPVLVKTSKKGVRKITPRPCNSRSRNTNRWTRIELENLAKQRGITGISQKNMNTLCQELGL